MTNTNEIKTPDDFLKRVEKAEGHGKGLSHINIRISCPDRFSLATPGAMDDKLKDWFKETGGAESLFVYGSVGTGKTHSTLALAKLLYINGIKSKFYNIIEFLDEIKENFKYPDFNIKSSLTVEHTLILDDFGAEKATDWTQEVIYRLINLRYENLLQTIFISNLSTAELGKVYGDRVVSRIIQMVNGKTGIINISGKDRRLK